MSSRKKNHTRFRIGMITLLIATNLFSGPQGTWAVTSLGQEESVTFNRTRLFDGSGQISVATGPGGKASVLLTNTNAKPVAVFTGPVGQTITSYSTEWATSNRLQMIYTELLNNYHRDEIKYLKNITLYPNYPYGEGVAGQYYGGYQWDSAGRRFYGKDASIEIYGCDERTDIDQLAKTIAHEYGHHFTMYYLWMKEGYTFQDWKKTGYAVKRNLTMDERVSMTSAHQWHPAEIAAEDYLQLFGSPRARKSYQFDSQVGRFDNSMFNISPQENLALPLAAQVAGLEEYWLALADDGGKRINQAPGAPELVLRDFGSGSEDYRRLDFAWSRSIDAESPHLEYTLVSYKNGETLAAPVKVQVDAYSATYQNYKHHEGKLNFRLFVKDEGGKITSSNILVVDLSRPVRQELPADPLYRDISGGHWAYPVIKELMAKQLVTGYADKTFRPTQAVTRAEFIALIVRSLQLPLVHEVKSFRDTKNHWAAAYIEAGKAAGLVDGYEAGNFYPDKKITRAEAAVIVTRAARLSLKDVTDVRYTDTAGHWAARIIANAGKANLLQGYPDGSFRPNNSLTRAESVALVYRFIHRN